jgi:hypothetical protein
MSYHFVPAVKNCSVLHHISMIFTVRLKLCLPHNNTAITFLQPKDQNVIAIFKAF